MLFLFLPLQHLLVGKVPTCLMWFNRYVSYLNKKLAVCYKCDHK